VALVTQDKRKAEVLNATFSLVSEGMTGLWKSQALETTGRIWSKEHLPLAEEDQLREYLCNLCIRKSNAPP